jgi:hypothetical protein
VGPARADRAPADRALGRSRTRSSRRTITAAQATRRTFDFPSVRFSSRVCSKSRWTPPVIQEGFK